jgi:hypothetical protein
VLRRISEPKVDEIIESWRKLHNEELHNTIRMIKSRGETVRACSTHGERSNGCRVMVGKSQ